MLRGEVIGAYPACGDPRAGACPDLHHAHALASIGSLWGTRPRGRRASKPFGSGRMTRRGPRQSRARIAAGPSCSSPRVATPRCFGSRSGVATVERWTCALKMLAQWLQPARLETRTKESNTYASSKVANLGCEMKVNAGGIPLGAPSTDHELL